MARAVYGFTKVKIQHTNRGIYGTVLGGIALIILCVLLIFSFVLEEGIPEWSTIFAYIGLFLSVIGYRMCRRASMEANSYGPCIKSGYILNTGVMIAYGMVAVIGCLAVIL